MPHRHNPRALLNPDMHQLLERMARAPFVPLHARTPSQARDAYEKGASVLDLAPARIDHIENFTITARDGYALPVRLYLPRAALDHTPLPVLVFFHGGGFVVGSLATHDSLCRTLCHLANCAVLAVDYRLAPEYRFPVAFEDAWDALAWMVQTGASHGIDVGRVAVGGDSAGGTLAAACALQARQQGLHLCLQLLFYPGCAAYQDSPSHTRFGKGFLLETAHIDYFFGHYLRNPIDRLDWRFAPLMAPDVDGVAPAWFGLAECDPVLDEGLQYADRLRAAGVAVDLEMYLGVVHDFIKMGRALELAKQAHRDAARALRGAFGL